MQILVLLRMYFDGVVVFVTSQTLIQIGSGHTVQSGLNFQNLKCKGVETCNMRPIFETHITYRKVAN